MNNEVDNNQHFITESFVKKRFGINGFVQKYDVEYDKWKSNASPRFIFSRSGYTQFLEEGQPVDNSLEKSFGNLENQLRIILPTLDDAALRDTTKLQESVYHNFCFYCAYLWYLSPFAKAKAPADFVVELDYHLQQGKWDYLLKQGVSADEVERMKEDYKAGKQFIIQGENYLQLVFRHQFIKNCKNKAGFFRYRTKWTVYNSPVELPISDIALIDYPEGKDARLCILPLSPNSVLIGRIPFDPKVYYSTDAIIYGKTLPKDAADEVLGIICGSAVKTIVCKQKMDIKGIRERGRKAGIVFHRIADLDSVLSAGLKSFDRKKDFRLVAVPKAEFVKYIHSFVLPPLPYTEAP